MDFTNKVALVTGAGSERGIGREVAQKLASYGCKVVITDINEKGLKEAAEKINAQFENSTIYKLLDVTKRDSVKTVVKETVQGYDKIDILINSAGITFPT